MFKYILPILVAVFFATSAIAECPTTSSGPLYEEGMYLGWFVNEHGKGEAVLNNKTGEHRVFASEQDAEHLFGSFKQAYGSNVLFKYENQQFMADNGQCVNIAVLTGGNIINNTGTAKNDVSTVTHVAAGPVKIQSAAPVEKPSEIVVFMSCVGDNTNFKTKCAEYEPAIANAMVFEDNGVGFIYYGTFGDTFSYIINDRTVNVTTSDGMSSKYNIVDGKYLIDPDNTENPRIRVTGHDKEMLKYRP